MERGREHGSRACAVAIALGSNLGDRRALLRSGLRAIGQLPGVTVLALSSIRRRLRSVPCSRCT
ncbi:MAG: hypothetical protein U5K74_03320 [Gemmatimonadaceae bacterium]|nr:hypothetical protein [Gemmatimonadaceae bacterium]